MRINRIKRYIKNERIVVFGCGNIGELVCQYLEKNGIIIDAVTDNDRKKWGKVFHGKQVKSPEEAIKHAGKACFIVANSEYWQEIKKQLESMGIGKERIFVVSEELSTKTAVIQSGMHVAENRHFVFHLPYSVSGKNFVLNIKYLALDLYSYFRRNIYRSATKSSKKYKVSICAIFKNEAYYLKEWIEFHKIIGIEHFYMYNNFSDDHYMEVLRPYIIAGEVTLIDWPVEQGQMTAYKNCFEQYGEESQWIGMIDIDEFVVPVQYNNIYSFLRKYERNTGSVLFYWKNFGTGGKVKRDYQKGLVTEDFTVCWRKFTDVGKCFVNTDFSCVFSQEHRLVHHEAWTEYKGRTFPPINCFGHIALFHKYNIVHSSKMPIQINHYLVKSLDELEMKLKKGDVFFKSDPGKRKYLMNYEKNNMSVDYSAYKYLAQLKQKLMADDPSVTRKVMT